MVCVAVASILMCSHTYDGGADRYAPFRVSEIMGQDPWLVRANYLGLVRSC